MRKIKNSFKMQNYKSSYRASMKAKLTWLSLDSSLWSPPSVVEVQSFLENSLSCCKATAEKSRANKEKVSERTMANNEAMPKS